MWRFFAVLDRVLDEVLERLNERFVSPTTWPPASGTFTTAPDSSCSPQPFRATVSTAFSRLNRTPACEYRHGDAAVRSPRIRRVRNGEVENS
ncbi:hypothetical protein C9J85_19580 [Haloferax sp. wsp5]|nr:hypothetical protein C9J85_19580 [Haloferax sp. wsp5]